jgi:hypothetical protein
LHWLNKIFIIITISLSVVFFVKQGSYNYVFYGDALGYYRYLPNTFIFNNWADISKIPAALQVPDNIISDEKGLANYPKSKLGYVINIYTYGVAAAELPFFAIAHLYAKLWGTHTANTFANGYSLPYHWAIKCSTLFYILLGFYFLYCTLKRYYNKDAAAFVCCTLLLSTNLWWFSIYQAGMAHSILWCAVSMLLYYTSLYHNSSRPKYLIYIIAVLGFIAICRPSDLLFALIPLLYGIQNKQMHLQKLQVLQQHFKYTLIGVGLAILWCMPQCIYWYKYSGSLWYDSYTNANTFNFRQPHIWEGIFSFRNGWIAYSPIFIFVVLGFIILKIKRSAWFWPSVIVLPIYCYIIYSWWCWNYINGHGSRPMIHLYPLLAIALAAIVGNKLFKQKLLTILSILIVIACVFYNIVNSTSRYTGWLWTEESNATYNFSTLFKKQRSIWDIIALEVGQVQPRQQFTTLDSFSTAATDTGFITKDVYGSLMLEPTLQKQYPDGVYIKVSGNFISKAIPPGPYDNDDVIMEIHRQGKIIGGSYCKLNNKINRYPGQTPPNQIFEYQPNTWGQVTWYYKPTMLLLPGDKLRYYVRGLSKNELYYYGLNLCVVR